MDRFNSKLNNIIRHIKRVEDNCNQLAKKLPQPMALKLIRLGRIHDASKLEPFEFEHLHEDSPLFQDALSKHRTGNPHHPEYWSSIHQMPDEYLAEMVCDCAARAQEFGTDIIEWFRNSATKKYQFTFEDECGKKIKKYLDLLLIPKFQ